MMSQTLLNVVLTASQICALISVILFLVGMATLARTGSSYVFKGSAKGR